MLFNPFVPCRARVQGLGLKSLQLTWHGLRVYYILCTRTRTMCSNSMPRTAWALCTGSWLAAFCLVAILFSHEWDSTATQIIAITWQRLQKLASLVCFLPFSLRSATGYPSIDNKTVAWDNALAHRVFRHHFRRKWHLSRCVSDALRLSRSFRTRVTVGSTLIINGLIPVGTACAYYQYAHTILLVIQQCGPIMGNNHKHI